MGSLVVVLSAQTSEKSRLTLSLHTGAARQNLPKPLRTSNWVNRLLLFTYWLISTWIEKQGKYELPIYGTYY